MIHVPGGENQMGSTVIRFPVEMAQQRKPRCAADKKHNNLGTQVAKIYSLTAALSGRKTAVTPRTVSMPSTFAPPIKAAKIYRVLPTSEAGRAYLRPRYIKHIAAAIFQSDAVRLQALYKKESFKMMPPSDKLHIAKAVLAHIKGLRLSSTFTEGLSACFIEAFTQGLGTRRDFRDWLEFTVNRLSVDTLENLVVAAEVNDDIREEATALVFECYS